MFTKLETYIKSYLHTERQELSLESLGSFRTKQNEPVISRSGEVLIPERTHVSYDDTATTTDLHFVSFCSSKENLSTAETEQWIKDEVSRVFDFMNRGKPWTIFGIGKFLLDGHNDLIFIPVVEQNLTVADEEDIPVVIAPVIEDDVEETPTSATTTSNEAFFAGDVDITLNPNHPTPHKTNQEFTGETAAPKATVAGAVPIAKGELKSKKTEKEKAAAKAAETKPKKKKRFLVPFIVILFLLGGTAGGYYYMASHEYIPDVLGIMHYFDHSKGHEMSKEEKLKHEQHIADSLATEKLKADSLSLLEEEIKAKLAEMLNDEKPAPKINKAPSTNKPKTSAPRKKKIDKDTGLEVDSNYMNVKVPADVMARSQGVAVPTSSYNVRVTAKQTGINSSSNKYARFQIITCETPNIEDAVRCSEAYAKKGFSTRVIDFSKGTFKVSIARANTRAEAEKMTKILAEKLGTRVEILEMPE